MKKGSIILIIVLVVVALIGFNGCSTYNNMNTSKLEVDNTWAKVQSAYQRRADLIPNLVATVKGAADFEKSTYVGVAAERAGNSAKNLKSATQIPADQLTPENMAKIQAANAQATKDAGLFINIAVEAYPQLRATQNFSDLQVQLEGTENRINTERNYFNDAVRNYNIKVTNVPGRFYAGIFGFTPREPFKADASAQESPKVQF